MTYIQAKSSELRIRCWTSAIFGQQARPLDTPYHPAVALLSRTLVQEEQWSACRKAQLIEDITVRLPCRAPNGKSPYDATGGVRWVTNTLSQVRADLSLGGVSVVVRCSLTETNKRPPARHSSPSSEPQSRALSDVSRDKTSLTRPAIKIGEACTPSGMYEGEGCARISSPPRPSSSFSPIAYICSRTPRTRTNPLLPALEIRAPMFAYTIRKDAS